MDTENKVPQQGSQSQAYRMSAVGALKETIQRMERRSAQLRMLLAIIEEKELTPEADEALWSLLVTYRG